MRTRGRCPHPGRYDNAERVDRDIDECYDAVVVWPECSRVDRKEHDRGETCQEMACPEDGPVLQQFTTNPT